jgi:hypothetical protein
VAQTDVTEQYIKNPGFEGTSTQFLQINKDGRGVQKPEGWSVEWYQDNTDSNGMTYVADNLNQDGKKWAAKNGKSYFARMRWANSTLYLRQTLRDLKPGKYTLSFSATGYRPKGNSIFNVTVGDKKADINLSTKDEAAWADYNIDFEIAEGQKFATITITADRKDDNFKIGIDEFKLTYDGSSYYPSLISKATSLYNDNKDWAKQADELNAAIKTNSGKTEIVDINAAIDAIEDAMATFKNANTVDVTAKIVNPNFDSNINGWTCEGGDGNNFQRQTSSQKNFNGGFLEKWKDSGNGSYSQKNFDVFQKLTNLPKGEYTVKAAIMATMQGVKQTAQKYQNKKHGGPYYIDNEHGVWFYGASGETTDMDWANTENKSFVSGAGAEYRTATVKVEDGNLTIGFKGVGSPDGKQLGTYANWIACDNWTLSYFGFDPTTLLAQIKTLKSSAEELINNDEYKNVVGEERKSLSDAKESTPEETKSALEAAISNLESAISAFTSAKTAYDNYAEEVAVAKKFGITVEAPATAAAATEALKTLNVAEYNAATNDYTAAIKLGEWTTTGASMFSNEHWSGETRSYLNQDDSNNQGWNSNNWTMTCKQTLTLPAGEYVFKAAGRKSANAFMKLSVKNGETLLGEVSNFPNGNVGLGITTDGKASFDSTDKFANKNNGWGWQWRFVPFTLEAETEITFDIEAGANEIHNWASFGDYTVMAKPSVATSTAAYNQAVEEANKALDVEANKVVTGEELAKLNDALAADKGTTMESIDAATKNIQECTTAFTAAQPKYQALVDAKALEQTILAYASEEKYTTFTTSKEATATSAADAETKANAIIAARRAYIESNGMAEGVVGAENCTDKVANPKFTGLDGQSSLEGWTRTQSGGNEGALNEQIWTNADANKGYYYDYYNGGANNQHVYQEVASLIPGKYIVTIKARAQAGFYLYLLINDEKKVDINERGSAGGDFERGWNDYTTEFTVGADGKVKIEVANMPSSNQSGWFGFGDVRLVRLGDLDAVALDETADNTIEAKVANVTLNRTLKAGKWNTLVLPFAVSADEVKTTFGEGVSIATYSNDEGVVINFATTTDIMANVPVLIKPTKINENNVYTFNGVTLVKGNPVVTGTMFDYVGCYAPCNLATNDYMLSNNQWWKNGETSGYKVKGFRAYVQSKNPEAAKQLTLVIDGQTTGLKLNTITGNIEGETYNMAGQRVANGYKGLVIKNGKKVINK